MTSAADEGGIDAQRSAEGVTARLSPSPGALPLVQKLVLAIRTLRNWPLLVLDRLSLMKRVRYVLRERGIVVTCRAATPDVNEVIAVCSGAEYPRSTIDRLPHGAVVLDVGANIGSFSLFTKVVNSTHELRGWSIEPFHENARLLSENLTENDLPFVVEEIAISDHDGTCHIDVDGSVDAIEVTDSPSGEVVKCERLSTFCAQRKIEHVDLLKLDVEGHEYAILEESQAFIRGQVDAIVMEWHRRGVYDRDTVVDSFEDEFDIVDVHRDSDSGVLILRNRGSRSAVDDVAMRFGGDDEGPPSGRRL